ncbi:hypothetical protein AGMMS49938_16880 [Fibrobacterales bacterium]|nr:hypothetical protein AGMMS49938_16880 [Fibrobacterales bacterium]
MLIARFETKAAEQIRQTKNAKYIKKVLKLVEDACEHPYTGLGKPEALKHELQGFWSRRIDSKNRIIYRVAEPNLIIISCIGHYE